MSRRNAAFALATSFALAIGFVLLGWHLYFDMRIPQGQATSLSKTALRKVRENPGCAEEQFDLLRRHYLTETWSGAASASISSEVIPGAEYEHIRMIAFLADHDESAAMQALHELRIANDDGNWITSEKGQPLAVYLRGAAKDKDGCERTWEALRRNASLRYQWSRGVLDAVAVSKR